MFKSHGNFKGGNFQGKVTYVDDNGKCSIEYDDGDTEVITVAEVSQWMKKLPKPPPPPPGNNPAANERSKKPTTTCIKYIGAELITWGSAGRSKSKYRSRIRIENKMISLGMFDTAKEAALRYDKEAILQGRTLSRLNFPELAPKNYNPQQKLRHQNTR